MKHNRHTIRIKKQPEAVTGECDASVADGAKVVQPQHWATINGGNGEIVFTGELQKSKSSLKRTINHLVEAFKTGNFEIIEE